MKRMILPLVFGLGGAAILVTLAVWQFQRLEWKEGLIAAIEARIGDAPVPLPESPDPARDLYLPVTVEGTTGAAELHVLTSVRPEGPGYRVIAALETAEGRRVLLDRGFVPEAAKDDPRPPATLAVTGNLAWPNETDSFTPDPNLERNIWFARDVPAMAAALGTEPVLIVQRSGQGWPRPQPVSVDLPNNHFQYAVTWSLLAVAWLAMTGYLLYRIRRNTV
ncbi:SURF1 family protein [Halovulum dunhuangense]|uniref:SURF1-like protein n=1 Tax=Halovulum dunhuangense TaxID=1505036 RepID=A0A849L0E7_9RHOB|nr:SURF1 family protein [Halovulum dunhuangense]NNU79729.1 SURF1 family protein [Halovulum dunhuangense]